MPVVDASIVVRLLLNRPGDDGLRDRFARDAADLHAPSLIEAEVVSAVRGLMLTSKAVIKVGTTRAAEMVDDFAELPVMRYPMRPYQARVLSLRHNFTAYDAFYVALAESLDMPLFTDDRKYAKAAGHTAVIDTYS